MTPDRQISVVAKEGKHEKISSSFVGIQNDQFIAKQLKLTSGHKIKQRPWSGGRR